MNLNRLLLLSCATGALVGLGGASFAQEATGIDEVVVTAEKRSQSVQDVPVSVTALTGESRDVQRITTVQDISNFTPSMTRTGSDRVNMRGAGKVTFLMGSDQGVASYTDGFYAYGFTEAQKPPMMVERVELLRGPQGTLYGRNALGGALNFYSPRPRDEWGGEMRAEVGNFDMRNLTATVTGPITDNFRIRATAGVLQRGEGFIENIGTGEDVGTNDKTYQELQLAWDITPDVSLWVRASTQVWDDTSGVENIINNTDTPYDFNQFGGSTLGGQYNFCAGGGPTGTTFAAPNPGLGGFTGIPGLDECNTTLGSPGAQANPGVTDLYTLSQNEPVRASMHDFDFYVAHLDANLGSGISLKYITGYLSYEFLSEEDPDRTSWEESYEGYYFGPTYGGVFGNALGCDPSATPFQPVADTGGLPAGPMNPLKSFCGAPSTISPQRDINGRQAGYLFSNEINIQNESDADFHWILGLFQYHDNTLQRISSTMPDQGEIAYANNWLQNDPDSFLLAALAGSPGLSLADLLYPDSVQPLQGNETARANGNNSSNSYAAYGQFDWKFTDALTWTFGLRYSHDQKSGYEDVAAILFNPIYLVPTSYEFDSGTAPGDLYQIAGGAPAPVIQGVVPLGSLSNARFEDSWNAVTGTTGVQWQPDSDTMMYARYSRGYLAGGFSLGGAVPDPSYDPTFVDAIELGLKKDWGPSLRTNFTLFHNEYEGFQTFLSDIQSTTQTATFQSANIDGRVYGAELEMIWQPLDALQFNLIYSYQNGEVTDAPVSFDPADIAATAPGAKPTGQILSLNSIGIGPDTDYYLQSIVGNDLPGVAENKITVNANYTWNTEMGALTLTGSFTHQDEVTQSAYASPAYVNPAFDTANFALIYNHPEGAFTAIASVRNAFDEEGSNSNGLTNPSGLRLPGSGDQGGYQNFTRERGVLWPRTFGVELQYRF